MKKEDALEHALDLASIGRRLKKFRQEHDMTQEQLGQILGINRTAVTNMEKGENGPSLKTLVRLEEQFNISARWVLTGKADEQGSEALEMSGKKKRVLQLINYYLVNCPEYFNHVAKELESRWKTFLDSKLFDFSNKPGPGGEPGEPDEPGPNED